MRFVLSASKRCYERQIANHKTLEGRVVAHFFLDPNGKPVIVRIAGSTLPSPTVQRCLVKAWSAALFEPPPDGYFVFRYPHKFAIGKPK